MRNQKDFTCIFLDLPKELFIKIVYLYSGHNSENNTEYITFDSIKKIVALKSISKKFQKKINNFSLDTVFPSQLFNSKILFPKNNHPIAKIRFTAETQYTFDLELCLANTNQESQLCFTNTNQESKSCYDYIALQWQYKFQINQKAIYYPFIKGYLDSNKINYVQNDGTIQCTMKDCLHTFIDAKSHYLTPIVNLANAIKKEKDQTKHYEFFKKHFNNVTFSHYNQSNKSLLCYVLLNPLKLYNKHNNPNKDIHKNEFFPSSILINQPYIPITMPFYAEHFSLKNFKKIFLYYGSKVEKNIYVHLYPILKKSISNVTFYFDNSSTKIQSPSFLKEIKNIIKQNHLIHFFLKRIGKNTFTEKQHQKLTKNLNDKMDSLLKNLHILFSDQITSQDTNIIVQWLWKRTYTSLDYLFKNKSSKTIDDISKMERQILTVIKLVMAPSLPKDQIPALLCSVALYAQKTILKQHLTWFERLTYDDPLVEQRRDNNNFLNIAAQFFSLCIVAKKYTPKNFIDPFLLSFLQITPSECMTTKEKVHKYLERAEEELDPKYLSTDYSIPNLFDQKDMIGFIPLKELALYKACELIKENKKVPLKTYTITKCPLPEKNLACIVINGHNEYKITLNLLYRVTEYELNLAWKYEIQFQPNGVTKKLAKTIFDDDGTFDGIYIIPNNHIFEHFNWVEQLQFNQDNTNAEYFYIPSIACRMLQLLLHAMKENTYTWSKYGQPSNQVHYGAPTVFSSLLFIKPFEYILNIENPLHYISHYSFYNLLHSYKNPQTIIVYSKNNKPTTLVDMFDEITNHSFQKNNIALIIDEKKANQPTSSNDTHVKNKKLPPATKKEPSVTKLKKSLYVTISIGVLISVVLLLKYIYLSPPLCIYFL